MNQDLKTLIGSMLRAVLSALIAVATTAFVTMPTILGHHPGDRASTDPSVVRLMT